MRPVTLVVAADYLAILEVATMRPSDVFKALVALITTRRPVYLWGPPGTGKSSLVRHV
jgi:MoxR-like ATPase